MVNGFLEYKSSFLAIQLQCLLLQYSGFFITENFHFSIFHGLIFLGYSYTFHRICIAEEILMELILALLPYSDNINQAKIANPLYGIATNHDLSIGIMLVLQHHTPHCVWLFNGDLSDPGMVRVNS